MKTFRLISVLLATFLMPLSVFAVNDFWIGYRYSVGVTFEVQGPSDVDPPRPKALPMPSFPIDLLQAGVQGHAVIQFGVRENGAVTDVSVVQADFDEFGSEAKKAVEKLSFIPGKSRKTGIKTEVQMRCRFDFGLSETEPAGGADKPTGSGR